MLSIKLTRFPNNEIRLRLAPLCIKRGSLSYESQVETQGEGAESPNLTLVPNSKLSEVTQKSLIKSGYGGECKRTKFGIYAKRTLLRVGGAIDKFDSNPSNGVFLTGTLPGSTHEAKKTIADWSAYIVHRLKAWVAKYVQEKLDFYVWELQKRGALHLHYYLYVPDPVARDRIIKGFKTQWIKLLENVCAKSGVDVFKKTASYSHRGHDERIQAYAQEVTKSVAAYLAKYCSKEASKPNSKVTSSYYPSRWWGVSRPLLALLRSMTHSTELLFASYQSARSKYEEVNSLLERHSIKGYRYGDKVGFGLNHVFYYSSEDLLSCYEFAKCRGGMVVQSGIKTRDELLGELARMVSSLKEKDKIWLGYWGNFSGDSRKAVLAMEMGDTIADYDAYSLSIDLQLVSVRALEYGYNPQSLYNRVRHRAEFIAAGYQALISLDAKLLAPLAPLAPRSPHHPIG